MNDEHDNAQADREIMRRFQCGDESHQHNCRHLETGVVHANGRVSPLRIPAIEGHGYLEQEAQELADAAQVQATIRADMSDLEIANEVIRVTGGNLGRAVLVASKILALCDGPEPE